VKDEQTEENNDTLPLKPSAEPVDVTNEELPLSTNKKGVWLVNSTTDVVFLEGEEWRTVPVDVPSPTDAQTDLRKR
jgi:hypothetical protein